MIMSVKCFIINVLLENLLKSIYRFLLHNFADVPEKKCFTYAPMI